MATRLSVWVAVASTIAAIVWPALDGIRIVAATAICTTALVAGLQADRLGRYLWLSTFVAIFVLFNPVMGVELQGRSAFVLTMLSLAIFVSWLIVLDRAVPSLVPDALRSASAE